MAKISFLKSAQIIEVTEGANLMQSLLQAGIPVASSCYGDGVCGKCRLIVIAGASHLSPANETEKILHDRERLDRQMRISCQAQVLGDITIDAPYW